MPGFDLFELRQGLQVDPSEIPQALPKGLGLAATLFQGRGGGVLIGLQGFGDQPPLPADPLPYVGDLDPDLGPGDLQLTQPLLRLIELLPGPLDGLLQPGYGPLVRGELLLDDLEVL